MKIHLLELGGIGTFWLRQNFWVNDGHTNKVGSGY